MKEYFFKLHPVFLVFVSICSGIIIFLVHIYMVQNEWIFWSFYIFVQTIIWFYLGILIIKLYENSYKDELTCLWNRRYFNAKLGIEIKKLKRYDNKLSIAIFDVDNFKCVNDTYGHLKGDGILVELANILKTNLRKDDIIVRYGGEEFIIILPNTDKGGAEVLCERLRKIVEQHDFGLIITVSVGIATSSHCIDISDFIEMADKALYRAKKTKNLVVSF